MKFLKGVVVIFLLISGTIVFAQEDDKNLDIENVTETKKKGETNIIISGVAGAVTINGANYQQIGLRPELKLWKFKLGLDIHVLLDEEGKVRKEDWDNWEDYMDKIYYISYGIKGEPFYCKYGGLDSTVLGYGIIMNGYTNMLEYPTYKRQGLDMSLETDFFGAEFILNDFKEVLDKSSSFMGGGRIYLRPFSRVQIGCSLAGDFNEYKGLRDTDGDGYPDEVDAYPEDDNYVTEIDYYLDHVSDENTVTDLVNNGLISDIERSNLANINDQKSKTGFWAADLGLKIIDTDIFNIDTYTQFSQCLNTGGWGFTVPGLRITSKDFFSMYAEYKQSSDEFIFAYYNNTYDLDRAKYVDDGTGNLIIETKKEKLLSSQETKGFKAGAMLKFFNIFVINGSYQDLRGKGDINDKSVLGEFGLNTDIIPKISKAKCYYVQNNVEKLKWKTESSVIGGVLGLEMGDGVSIDFNYMVTFEDLNGDGEISGEDETIKNISVSTSAVF